MQVTTHESPCSVSRTSYPVTSCPVLSHTTVKTSTRTCLTYLCINKHVFETALFWDITQRHVVIVYRCFGTTCQSHFHGSRDPSRWDRHVVPKHQLTIITQRRLISQKNTDLNNIAAEAWNQGMFLCVGGTRSIKTYLHRDRLNVQKKIRTPEIWFHITKIFVLLKPNRLVLEGCLPLNAQGYSMYIKRKWLIRLNLPYLHTGW